MAHLHEPRYNNPCMNTKITKSFLPSIANGPTPVKRRIPVIFRLKASDLPLTASLVLDTTAPWSELAEVGFVRPISISRSGKLTLPRTDDVLTVGGYTVDVYPRDGYIRL